jgi:vancomycin resistance protein YoaR
MLRAGFNYVGNPPNVNDFNGKTINLSYLENSYIFNLEEFCSINLENQCIEIKEDVLAGKINEIAAQINKIAVAAKITDEKNFVIEKETDGISVDEILLIQSIKDYLDAGNIVDAYAINIPVVVTKPEMTEEILNKIKTTELSSFSTKFKSSQKDRTINLKISTEIINWTVVYPGEVFSMDNELGERTAAKGYKNAPVFSGRKVTLGLAGGICQTTTTTYNAALLANLQILERYRHSLPVTYIGKGRDAAISRNVQDLKFKNNTGYPIYIKANIDIKKELMTVKIYGYQKNFNINIATERQSKNRRTYYRTYRNIYDIKNLFIKKELVSTDIY